MLFSHHRVGVAAVLLPLGTLPHLEDDVLVVGCVSDEHARAQPAEPGAREAHGLQLLDQYR